MYKARVKKTMVLGYGALSRNAGNKYIIIIIY